MLMLLKLVQDVKAGVNYIQSSNQIKIQIFKQDSINNFFLQQNIMTKSKVIFIAFFLFTAVSAFAQRYSKFSEGLRDFLQKSSEMIAQKDSIHNGHTYVDLGLSVKWATCNVGAYYSDNPGKHYAWGETTTKGSYTSSNSKTFGVSMGDISGNPNYDVARATWGGTWRLPTSEEFEELIQCCTWTWTTENGQKGYKVTSRRNGNSIFLPAAGRRCYDSSFNGAGYGYYWSSSPYDSKNAYLLIFNSSEYRVDWGHRYLGFSVRAVCE